MRPISQVCCSSLWFKLFHSLSVYSRPNFPFGSLKKFCHKLHNKSQIVPSEKERIDQNIWQWKLPEGYNTGIQVYNQFAHKTVPLVLLNKQLATWYMCGPTVYDDAHIGHACCYIKFDIIRRILEKFFSVDVVMAMGITNIDDKIIQRSKELNVSIEHITQHYEQEFFHDMGQLGMLPPTVVLRVTDHISEIISFCEKIVNSGKAYVTPTGSVYIDHRKFHHYGKLSGQTTSDDISESQDSHKKDSKDFALWKSVKPGEPWWNSPWGKGRPGWHIECSAMASHTFGQSLDIHTGGIDLLFPHHENEEIQCEAYHGISQWANYWIHTGHLHLKGHEKMSKSLKNTISIKEFLKENSAHEFRIFCLQSLYQNNVEFADSSLDKAKITCTRLRSFLKDAEAYVDGQLSCSPFDDDNIMKCLSDTRAIVQQALAANFNTAKALDAILNLVALVNKNLHITKHDMSSARSSGVIASCSSFVANTLELFGLSFTGRKDLTISGDASALTLSKVMDALVKFRRKVRLYALTTGSTSQPQHKMQNVILYKEEPSESLPLPPDQPPADKGDMQWTTQQKVTSKEQLKIKRTEREPLVQACDDLRNDLFISGIQIMDKGKESSWSILEDKSLEGKKSSLASHDAFDPLYKPRR